MPTGEDGREHRKHRHLEQRHRQKQEIVDVPKINFKSNSFKNYKFFYLFQ